MYQFKVKVEQPNQILRTRCFKFGNLMYQHPRIIIHFIVFHAVCICRLCYLTRMYIRNEFLKIDFIFSLWIWMFLKWKHLFHCSWENKLILGVFIYSQKENTNVVRQLGGNIILMWSSIFWQEITRTILCGSIKSLWLYI